MDDLILVANTLFNWVKRFYDSLMSDWGILGYAIVSSFVIARVIRFMRKMFR